MLPGEVKKEKEKEDALACLLNAILKVKSLLKEDLEVDDMLRGNVEDVMKSFLFLEDYWDFYHRQFEVAAALI